MENSKENSQNSKSELIINKQEDRQTSDVQESNKSNEQNKEFKTSLSSQHLLNSEWVFWYISRKEKDFDVPYEERLKKIASFATLEEFFKYYVYLKSASEVDRNSDLSIFKEGYKPLWESCPDGGCWFIRFKKSDDPGLIDVMWEKLVFALIGEQFEEPHMLGAVLSIRGRETIIEVWFNYMKNDIVKASILDKFKELISIDSSLVVYFKDNQKAFKDKSTLRNAETYNLGGPNINHNNFYGNPNGNRKFSHY